MKLLTDRQTNRQKNKRRVKHNLLDGGKYRPMVSGRLSPELKP